MNKDMDAKITPKQLNMNYFRSFIMTRGSIEQLVVISIVCLILGFAFISVWNYVYSPLITDGFGRIISPVLFTYNIIFLITSLTFLLPISRRFLYKNQGFASAWLVLLSVLLTHILVTLVYGLLLMIMSNKTGLLWYDTFYSLLFMFLSFVLYIVSIIYNTLWLKKQLTRGVSEERAFGNYRSSSEIYSKKSLWIIFGFTVVGTFITGSALVVFSLFCAVLFIVAFSRYTVEAVYASYLLNTDKTYWVNYTENTKTDWVRVIKIRSRKLSTYTSISIISIVLLTYYEIKYGLPDEIPDLLGNYIAICYLWFPFLLIVSIVKKIRVIVNKQPKYAIQKRRKKK